MSADPVWCSAWEYFSATELSILIDLIGRASYVNEPLLNKLYALHEVHTRSRTTSVAAPAPMLTKAPDQAMPEVVPPSPEHVKVQK